LLGLVRDRAKAKSTHQYVTAKSKQTHISALVSESAEKKKRKFMVGTRIGNCKKKGLECGKNSTSIRNGNARNTKIIVDFDNFSLNV